MNIGSNKLKPVKYFFYLILLICASCKEPKPPQVTFDIPVFDVPALLGKNIDEVRKVLGKPKEGSPEPPDPKEKGSYVSFYSKSGQDLFIYYNPYTRKIKSFQIMSSEGYKNITDLLKLGNLHFMENLDYRIEVSHPFFSNDFNNFIVELK